MKKIMIIGDSHTRSFALRNNIYPVFLGNGKKINLSNTSLIYLEKQLVKLFKKVNRDDYHCFIYLGEPNVRYQLMNNWYPHLEDKIKINVNKSYLSKCASNYIKIAEKYTLSIITPTTGLDECIIPMNFFKNISFDQFDNRDFIKAFNNNKFNTLTIKQDSENIFFRVIKKIFNNDKSNC